MRNVARNVIYNIVHSIGIEWGKTVTNTTQ
jgi:hypothetical protein